MGLFDFLRRKSEPPSDSDTTAEDELDPRFVHYHLAHALLRDAALGSPLKFLVSFASPELAERFLRRAVEVIAEHRTPGESDSEFPIDEIRIHPLGVAGFPCVVIEMPEPRAVTETFFVAAVVLADLSGPLPDPAAVQARYFTLEKGIRLGGPSRTVLCEWTSDGTHRNYGDGPEPSLDVFVKAVERLL